MSICRKCLFFFVIASVSTFGQTVQTANVTFTTIDVPGAGVTGVYGVNSAGDLVGYYANSPSDSKHAFLLQNGVFTLFDYPAASSTIAYGINDEGLIAGSAEFNAGSSAVGFLYDGTTFTPIIVKNQSATYVFGINDAGDTVGSAGDADTDAFELQNGRLKIIQFPGTYFVANATGINSFSQVAGWTTDGVNTRAYEYSHGKFLQIAVPGAVMTEALGINDKAIVVGWYDITGPADYAFAFRGGRYISFRYPGAQTFAAGINIFGQVVGQYTFDFQTWHGYVTAPIANLIDEPTPFDSR